MAQAEAEIRKAHKNNPGTDRLANAARLSALERNLGVEVKRHRDPVSDQIVPLSPDQDKNDGVVVLARES